MSIQARGADGAGVTAEIGPRTITTVRQTCEGCPSLALEEWRFEGENDEIDSGTDAVCGAAGKNIASYWSEKTRTPDWCPALASPRADSAERTAGDDRKWTVPRAVLVEAVAQHFHDEEHEHGGHAWTWPEYADDDGRRGNSGYVSITPPVVQMECREAAERLVRLFEGYVATPAPATPPGVLKLAGQLVDEIDGLIETTDGIAGLHRNGDLATWEELLPEGEYERLSSLDMLRDALAAANTAGATATPPGVPDSLRALSAAAYDAGFDASGEGWNGEYPDNASKTPVYELRRRQCLDALIAAHPAGQSAGSGADARNAIARWVAIEGAAETLIVAADNALDGSARFRARLKEAADEMQAALNVPEPNTAWMRAAAKPAPDSTRTGQVSVPLVPTEAMWRAFGTLTPEAFRQKWTDALAARPAAPEAQGAWRPISTAPKDGSEVLVFVPAEREQFVAFWHSNGFWQYAYVEPTHTTLVCHPTDWQPLPAPPASSGQGER